MHSSYAKTGLSMWVVAIGIIAVTLLVIPQPIQIKP